MPFPEFTELSSTPLREIKRLALKQNIRNLVPCSMYYLRSYKHITIVIISPLILLFVYQFGLRHISLNVSRTTRSLPVHINYIAIYCSLSILFIMSCKFLVSSELFRPSRPYTQTQSQFCFLRIF